MHACGTPLPTDSDAIVEHLLVPLVVAALGAPGTIPAPFCVVRGVALASPAQLGCRAPTQPRLSVTDWHVRSRIAEIRQSSCTRLNLGKTNQVSIALDVRDELSQRGGMLRIGTYTAVQAAWVL